MITPATTELLDSVIAIIEKIKLNDDVSSHADFKKLMTAVTTSAMKGNTTLVVKQKKASTAYNDFVKAKMPELKDKPMGEKFKLIGEMWAEHKAANKNDESPVAAAPIKKEKAVPKPAPVKKEKNQTKKPSKTVVVDSSDDASASSASDDA
jgi:hypothetical protein